MHLDYGDVTPLFSLWHFIKHSTRMLLAMAPPPPPHPRAMVVAALVPPRDTTAGEIRPRPPRHARAQPRGSSACGHRRRREHGLRELRARPPLLRPRARPGHCRKHGLGGSFARGHRRRREHGLRELRARPDHRARGGAPPLATTAAASMGSRGAPPSATAAARRKGLTPTATAAMSERVREVTGFKKEPRESWPRLGSGKNEKEECSARARRERGKWLSVAWLPTRPTISNKQNWPWWAWLGKIGPYQTRPQSIFKSC
jgi:hypothetical protein